MRSSARFNGRSAEGELLWNFVGIDGSTNWPVLWIGEAVGAPPSPLKPWHHAPIVDER
jgi:hypothetical protein